MTQSIKIGQTFGKYQIIESLGRGGMAEVYKAYQETLDRHVAIKVMHTFLAEDSDFLGRFKREARAMAALSHPHIVRVYDFEIQDDVYYIVMEYVSGGTLTKKLEELSAKGQWLPLQETLKIILQVAEAMAYAHRQGMIHRDIKPSNIMLNEQGNAVLTDFGLAKILSGPTYTATNATIGTPAYMSPEQGMGETGDGRSDIYALSVLLFQMVTGRLPYQATTPLATLMKHISEPIPSPLKYNPNVPAGVQQIIQKGMAKEPEARYQTANDLIRDLQQAIRLAESDVTATLTVLPTVDLPTPGPTQLGPKPAPPKIPWLWVGVGGFLVLLFLVGLGVIFSAGRGQATPTPESVVIVEPTATHSPSPTPTYSPEAATATLGPTATAIASPSPTATPTASHTPTLAPSPTLLATCLDGVELVNTYTYQSPQFRAAPAGSTFPINWVLANRGNCQWPAGLQWIYVEGESFGQSEPIAVDSQPEAGQEITLTATFRAPTTPNAYSSTWQLVTAAGEPFGLELSFTIQIYSPTPTPTITPAVTATPTPTTVAASQLDFNVFPDNNCEYPGNGPDWRCAMTITVFGGGGGPYIVWVFDANPPIRYDTSGTATHFIQARRCNAWNHEIKVEDPSSGQSLSKSFFLDPETFTTFPTGPCTTS